MSIEDHIKNNLESGQLLQLATAVDGSPWVCTVYFVADDSQNLYWLSLPSRRHSQELGKNPKASIAIAIKYDQPVIGLQAEGKVQIVENAEIVKNIMQKYVSKYNSGKEFYDNFVAGKMEHRLYKFVPSKYALFDEVNFPGGEAKQWQIN